MVGYIMSRSYPESRVHPVQVLSRVGEVVGTSCPSPVQGRESGRVHPFQVLSGVGEVVDTSYQSPVRGWGGGRYIL